MQTVSFLSNWRWENTATNSMKSTGASCYCDTELNFYSLWFPPDFSRWGTGYCGKPKSTVNQVTPLLTWLVSKELFDQLWIAPPGKCGMRTVGLYESKTEPSISDSWKLTLLSFCSLWWPFLLDLAEVVRKLEPFSPFPFESRTCLLDGYDQKPPLCFHRESSSGMENNTSRLSHQY